jgi:hypothetical protein
MNRPHFSAPAAKHLAIFQQFQYVIFRIVFFYLVNLEIIAAEP